MTSGWVNDKHPPCLRVRRAWHADRWLKYRLGARCVPNGRVLFLAQRGIIHVVGNGKRSLAVLGDCPFVAMTQRDVAMTWGLRDGVVPLGQ